MKMKTILSAVFCSLFLLACAPAQQTEVVQKTLQELAMEEIQQMDAYSQEYLNNNETALSRALNVGNTDDVSLKLVADYLRDVDVLRQMVQNYTEFDLSKDDFKEDVPLQALKVLTKEYEKKCLN